MISGNKKYTDIPFFLTKNPYTNDFNVIHDDNAIRSSVKNLLSTIPGERQFNQKLGSVLYVVGSSLDKTDRIEVSDFSNSIRQAIYQNDRRLTNVSVKIVNEIVDVSFTTIDKQDTRNINIKMDNNDQRSQFN